jgi:DNA uptake protein ComE-like DNA-binding protein
VKAPPTSPSNVAAALIVCAMALVALARSDVAPRTASQPVALRVARPTPTGAGVRQLVRGQALELNAASVGDLVLLPGIGPKLAQRIVDERARRGGAYGSLDELRSVKGVGAATWARIRPLLRLDHRSSASEAVTRTVR